MRKSVLKFMAAGLAAATLSAWTAPVQAQTQAESQAQDLQGWCDVVPPFCNCGEQGPPSFARCRPRVAPMPGEKPRDVH
jgi:hypothetical protein